MKGNILVILMMICQLYTTKDIKVQIESYSYINEFSGSKNTFIEYNITNKSDEPYFTWVDFNNHNTKGWEKIYRYFFTFYDDMNLATLMTDNVVRISDEIILGKTFIKRLSPGESFKYIVVNEKENSDFSKSIVIEKVSSVSKIIGFNVPESFEYDKTELIVL